MTTKSFDSGPIRRLSRADILAASRAVKDIFPFPGYITPGQVNGMVHVAMQVTASCRGSALLDIGSGPMDKTAVFRKLGFDCHATDDLSDAWHQKPGNLEKIMGFAKTIGIAFHRQKGGETDIPFPKGSFDVVTLFDVIEHLHESPRAILNAAGAHLKTGGILCITMPNSVNLRKRLSVCFGATNFPPADQFYWSPGRWRGHVREYTLQETVAICGYSGFEVVSATTFEGIAYDKLRLPLLQGYLLLGGLFPSIRSCICVVARKPRGWSPVQEDADAFRKAVAASLPPGIR